jgi:hypothetical protein
VSGPSAKRAELYGRLAAATAAFRDVLSEVGAELDSPSLLDRSAEMHDWAEQHREAAEWHARAVSSPVASAAALRLNLCTAQESLDACRRRLAGALTETQRREEEFLEATLGLLVQSYTDGARLAEARESAELVTAASQVPPVNARARLWRGGGFGVHVDRWARRRG